MIPQAGVNGDELRLNHLQTILLKYDKTFCQTISGLTCYPLSV